MGRCAYTGKILRVNLAGGVLSHEVLDSDFIKKYVGGAGFGARYLYQENPDGVEWADPENRIIQINETPCILTFYVIYFQFHYFSTITYEPFGPGTEPLTTSKLFSGINFTT